MRKSELQKVTDIDVDSSSSVTNTIQSSTVTTKLSEDKVDDDTTSDESLVKQDKNIGSSIGNVESASISSVEFVDIVSGKWKLINRNGYLSYWYRHLCSNNSLLFNNSRKEKCFNVALFSPLFV